MVNIESLKSTLDSIRADWNIPGISVTAIKDGETLLAEGIGAKSVEGGAQVDAQTAFAIGSCTKSITSVALGILVDEGKIGWDDKVVTHLPDFVLYDDWVTQHVTVRDMLSHRVGIQRALPLYLKGDMLKSEIVHRMRYFQPVDEFRANFRYGNSHYTLAGELVAAVSGQSWADFVRERVFVPLNMSNSYTCYQNMIAGTENYTQAHSYMEDSLIPPSSHMSGEGTVVAWADIGDESAGSIITTANDMVGWLTMLLNQGAPLLKPETFATITHPQIVPRVYEESEFAPFAAAQSPANIYAYGLGFYLLDYRGYKAIVGGGQIQGMNAAFMVVPGMNVGGAVMVNTYHTLGYLALILTVIDALMDTTDRDWSAPFMGMAQAIRQSTVQTVQRLIDAREDVAPSLALSDYAGTYHNDLYGDFVIAANGDHLTLTYGPDYSGTLTHWQGDQFVFENTTKTVSDKALMAFSIKGGSVTALSMRDGTTFARSG
jgi:CubicO group peptidase (beta-lactamase class C family)